MKSKELVEKIDEQILLLTEWNEKANKNQISIQESIQDIRLNCDVVAGLVHARNQIKNSVE